MDRLFVLICVIALGVISSAGPVAAQTDENTLLKMMQQGNYPIGDNLSDNGGMFIIPKPTSTQKQQEILTKKIDGTINNLTSQTLNQTKNLENRLSQTDGLLANQTQKLENRLAQTNVVLTNQTQKLENRLVETGNQLSTQLENFELKLSNLSSNLNNLTLFFDGRFEDLKESTRHAVLDTQNDTITRVVSFLSNQSAVLEETMGNQTLKAFNIWIEQAIEVRLKIWFREQFFQFKNHVSDMVEYFNNQIRNGRVDLLKSLEQSTNSKIFIF